jgi:hypothetical protein
MKREAFLALVFSLSLTACSGSDTDGGGHRVAGVPSAFSAYCTGTLKRPVGLQERDGPSVWMGSSSTGEAPTGSTFLVEASFDKWGGFVFGSDGAPLRLDGEFKTGLVKDQDFTSDCAVDPTAPKTANVLLAASTFHPNEDLSGEACTLPAGTELTSFGFISKGSVAMVSAAEIQAQCSLAKSYSKDIVYGDLLPK